MTEPRTWVVIIPAPEPMKSANKRENVHATARSRKAWRETAYGRIAQAKLPRGLARVRVDVELRFPTGRRRDASNFSAAVIKPCVDALTPEQRKRNDDGSLRVERGWGVVADDSAGYVDLREPVIGPQSTDPRCPYGLVVLRVTDLTDVPRGRTWTPSTWTTLTPGSGTRAGGVIAAKRACNGCGEKIGDPTDLETAYALAGKPLPDVRGECPNCSREAVA